MSNIVKNINAAGGEATFTSLQGATHGTSLSRALTKEVLDWLWN